MTPLPWYFDVISPFAYLQLEWLQRDHPELVLDPRPVVLGAVLAHHGQLGPAEIPGKREFTYRYVVWRAQELGVQLKFPPRHPFNPLPALRLILAAGSTLRAVQAVFRHIWRDGHAGETIAELAPVMAELGIDASSLSDAMVKDALRASTEPRWQPASSACPRWSLTATCSSARTLRPLRWLRWRSRSCSGKASTRV